MKQMINEYKGPKIIMLCVILFLGLLINPLNVRSYEADDFQVLVIYSSSDKELNEHQRLLDLLIGHFTSSITFKHSSEVKTSDIIGVTHLFYYGQVEEKLPEKVIDIINSYPGPIMGIGHNVEQVNQFNFIESTEIEILNDFIVKREHGNSISISSHPMMKLITTREVEVLVEVIQGEKRLPLLIDEAEVLLEVVQEEERLPLLINEKDAYYFASPNLFPPISNFLADELHHFFGINHDTETNAILRLEDINPKTDPEDLFAIAEVLKDRNIPYMASVTPVYVNPKTDEKFYLSDNPGLITILKEMQNNEEHKASIVLHGYTDQYKNAETGDGFEFWDVENNKPLENEGEYIEDRISRGLQELVNYGIYPKAFEAPHYAMSQKGYEVISRFFSTYVGQVQLTDTNWEIMTEAPYITEPKFLKGMKLIPETIRYIRYEEPTSIREMKDRIDEFTIVRDGIIGAFYHPFLGVEGLKELLDEMEKIPNLTWMDLSKMDNKVFNEDGEELINKDQEGESNEIGWMENYIIQLKEVNIVWIVLGFCITGLTGVISYMLFRRKVESI
ncbi:DUF2334 domain-containing protein [Ornithinibacillus salinisoli]|uniref:DUF2334 domain-containing protein n=1 Tax=Ornithinibacillus salinisoli TaxID=1848459 RepID=A0ABW4VZ93_9BACI